MNNEMKFADGMNFRARNENAPETVRGAIYFKWAEFRKFCEENVDEKGFVNVKMMKSKNTGGIYFILDTYKPKTDPAATAEYNDNKYRHPDEGVQASNERMEAELFQTAMSDEENKRLANLPF